jgi:hypothetical protein
MKNIQIIADRLTCTYDIFQATEEEFSRVFPGPGQDIEFASDLMERIGEEYEELISRIFDRRVSKPDVVGIHGILFYNFDYKREMYPNKTRADMDVSLATAEKIFRKLQEMKDDKCNQPAEANLGTIYLGKKSKTDAE